MPLFSRRKHTPPVPSQMEPQTPGVQVTTVGGTVGLEQADATGPVDEWADPPAVDLALADSIVDDGRTVMTDEQAMARLGQRLGRGVAFMGGRKDVRLVVHEDRDHGAWAWLDEDLVKRGADEELDPEDEEAPALHVSLKPLLGAEDAAGVNPLKPEGRRAHPSIPGGLAHVAAHLRHTRTDEALLAQEEWPVRAAATMLEEVRCEARQIKERPWDSVYLRASALLWTLPDGEDERWRTAYLALMTLGRRTAGILRPEDTLPVDPMVEAVFSKREKTRLIGVWSKALRLEDGDTQGLIDLAAQWVKIVAPKSNKGVFADPCAARTRHMSIPLDGDGDGGGGSSQDDSDSDSTDSASEGSTSESGADGDAAGSDGSGDSEGDADEQGSDGQGQSDAQGDSDSDGEGDSSSGQGESEPTGTGGQGQSKGQGQSQGSQGGQDGAQGDAGGQQGGQGGQSGATGGGWGDVTPDLEWDDPMALALDKVAQNANEGAKEQLEAERRAEQERQELVAAVNKPLDDATRDARERQALAAKAYERSPQGHLVHPTTVQYRNPTKGEERLARDLEQALRRAKFRERGKTKVAFEQPPGRLSGRDMVQRRAQKAMGQVPTARAWKRIVYATTPSPMIYALILGDRSGSMQWASGPLAAMTWAFSRAVTAVGGRASALTFGRDVRVLADAGSVLPKVPVYDSKDADEQFTEALKAGDGRMNLTGARGVRCVFVMSDGFFSPRERETATKELKRLVADGVRVVWISLGVSEKGKTKAANLGMAAIFDWAPPGVEVVGITSQKTMGHIIGKALAGTLVDETAKWTPEDQ